MPRQLIIVSLLCSLTMFNMRNFFYAITLAFCCYGIRVSGDDSFWWTSLHTTRLAHHHAIEAAVGEATATAVKATTTADAAAAEAAAATAAAIAAIKATANATAAVEVVAAAATATAAAKATAVEAATAAATAAAKATSDEDVKIAKSRDGDAIARLDGFEKILQKRKLQTENKCNRITTAATVECGDEEICHHNYHARNGDFCFMDVSTSSDYSKSMRCIKNAKDSITAESTARQAVLTSRELKEKIDADVTLAAGIVSDRKKAVSLAEKELSDRQEIKTTLTSNLEIARREFELAEEDLSKTEAFSKAFDALKAAVLDTHHAKKAYHTALQAMHDASSALSCVEKSSREAGKTLAEKTNALNLATIQADLKWVEAIRNVFPSGITSFVRTTFG